MISPFRSQYQITQVFGNNPTYYGQFGLKGHEGIDLIPTGSVWDVLCLADGVVVTDSDDPQKGAYGDFVTVWHPQLKKATQYCHFKENYVSGGQKVVAGQKLGLMGSSGNVTGPHLHLNLYEVDENGVRLNKNNGFNGGIDPLPFLEGTMPQPTIPPEIQAIIDQERLDRDKNWNLYQGELQENQDLKKDIDAANKEKDELWKEIQGFSTQLGVPMSSEKIAGEIQRLITAEDQGRKTAEQLQTSQQEAIRLAQQLSTTQTESANWKKKADESQSELETTQATLKETQDKLTIAEEEKSLKIIGRIFGFIIAKEVKQGGTN